MELIVLCGSVIVVVLVGELIDSCGQTRRSKTRYEQEKIRHASMIAAVVDRGSRGAKAGSVGVAAAHAKRLPTGSLRCGVAIVTVRSLGQN